MCQLSVHVGSTELSKKENVLKVKLYSTPEATSMSVTGLDIVIGCVPHHDLHLTVISVLILSNGRVLPIIGD